MDFYMIAFGEAFRPLLDYAASIGLVPDPRIVSVPATIGLLALILKKGADIGVKALRGVCAVLSEARHSNAPRQRNRPKRTLSSPQWSFQIRPTMVTAIGTNGAEVLDLEPLFLERFEEDVEEASDTTVTFRSFFWMSFSSLPFGRSSFLVQPHRHPLSV